MLFKLFEKNNELFSTLTRAQAAKILTQMMGVEVSVYYVEEAEKITGLLCKRIANAEELKKVTTPTSDQVASSSDVAPSKDRVGVVARALVDLMNELGCAVPEGLLCIAKHQRNPETSTYVTHEKFGISISDGRLGLSHRVVNRLKSAGIETVRSLIASTRNDLLRIPTFGEIALAEVQTALRTLGLSLKGE